MTKMQTSRRWLAGLLAMLISALPLLMYPRPAEAQGTLPGSFLAQFGCPDFSLLDSSVDAGVDAILADFDAFLFSLQAQAFSKALLVGPRQLAADASRSAAIRAIDAANEAILIFNLGYFSACSIFTVLALFINADIAIFFALDAIRHANTAQLAVNEAIARLQRILNPIAFLLDRLLEEIAERAERAADRAEQSLGEALAFLAQGDVGEATESCIDVGEKVLITRGLVLGAESIDPGSSFTQRTRSARGRAEDALAVCIGTPSLSGISFVNVALESALLALAVEAEQAANDAEGALSRARILAAQFEFDEVLNEAAEIAKQFGIASAAASGAALISPASPKTDRASDARDRASAALQQALGLIPGVNLVSNPAAARQAVLDDLVQVAAIAADEAERQLALAQTVTSVSRIKDAIKRCGESAKQFGIAKGAAVLASAIGPAASQTLQIQNEVQRAAAAVTQCAALPVFSVDLPVQLAQEAEASAARADMSLAEAQNFAAAGDFDDAAKRCGDIAIEVAITRGASEAASFVAPGSSEAQRARAGEGRARTAFSACLALLPLTPERLKQEGLARLEQQAREAATRADEALAVARQSAADPVDVEGVVQACGLVAKNAGVATAAAAGAELLDPFALSTENARMFAKRAGWAFNECLAEGKLIIGRPFDQVPAFFAEIAEDAADDAEAGLATAQQLSEDADVSGLIDVCIDVAGRFLVAESAANTADFINDASPDTERARQAAERTKQAGESCFALPPLGLIVDLRDISSLGRVAETVAIGKLAERVDQSDELLSEAQAASASGDVDEVIVACGEIADEVFLLTLGDVTFGKLFPGAASALVQSFLQQIEMRFRSCIALPPFDPSQGDDGARRVLSKRSFLAAGRAESALVAAEVVAASGTDPVCGALRQERDVPNASLKILPLLEGGLFVGLP